ncbi:MAG: hypothetical protein IT432_10465 [Phycisphaerales bacterium]|nr:hypothetical protein [Phycisphaerales bacterium]
MLTSEQLERLADVLYQEPDLYGCKVVYFHRGVLIIVRPGIIPSVNYDRVVVIEETEERGGMSRDALSRSVRQVSDSSGSSRAESTRISNRSRIGSELVGVGLSCGMAVISGVGVVGGAAAEVPSAGTSTILVVAAWTGFVTSGLQCLNGVVRVSEAVQNPDGSSLQEWDSNVVYSYATNIVDALGVISGGVAVAGSVRGVLRVLQTRGALVTAEELSRMSAASRTRAIRDAVARVGRSQEGRRELREAMRAAGLTEREADAALSSAGYIGRTQVVRRVVSEQMARRLGDAMGQARSDAIMLGAGVAISGTSPRHTGSGSGSVRTMMLYFHIVDPDEPYESP